MKNAPLGKRSPKVNTKPSLLRIRATAALVFQSPTLLRMPMLNWSEYGTFKLLLRASISAPTALEATSPCKLDRPVRYFGSHATHGVPKQPLGAVEAAFGKYTVYSGNADLVTSTCR